METMRSYAEDIDGGRSPSVSMLSEVAAARKITIVGGSVPEMASGQLFNTCCVVGPDGEIKAKHRKLHLFGIDIPGDITFRESDTFTAGQEPTVVDTVLLQTLDGLVLGFVMISASQNWQCCIDQEVHT
ncbi:unnamed protein product [Triticum turgidum subsp. durum]|uniref:CN hydrolase domain-containing protein n=1 Tax=Triticum turgidum subsp. durum TaxID=4567 RepID=A0A9R0Z5V0_TRITD|nr:unnamed protein product [Triticum turgidum subsp. durum]